MVADRNDVPEVGELAAYSRTPVTVYSTGPSCQQCKWTCVRLEAAGIPYRVIELADLANAAAREYVADLGYTQAPVVTVGDDPQHHWSGFRPDLIDRLANPAVSR